MSFKKIAIIDITALNHPEGWEIYNLPNQIKTASIDLSIDEDLGGFDLKQATKEFPEHLYMKIFAIKKDEPNDNGDAFSEDELQKSTHTFIGVPLFTNHQNDDVEKARGECVHAWYDKKKGGIFLVARVDKIAYPRLARAIEQKYVKGTSMGTSVEYSCCSICHKKSETPENYCTHIKERKNRNFYGDIKCAYHEDSNVPDDEKCPLCGSIRKTAKIIKHNGTKIYEHNYGLRFIENSFVVSPACHECGVSCILHVPELQKKVASLRETVDELIKYSERKEIPEELKKVAGVRELNDLKESMTKLETVVQSMLKQKEQVSMEYVSDLVKAMADVQGIADELVEMGYAKLPSPTGITEEGDATLEPQTFSEPVGVTGTVPQIGQGEGQFNTQELGGIGSITKPAKSFKKIKDFLSISGKLLNKVSSLKNILFKNKQKDKNMADIITEVSANIKDPESLKILISKIDGQIFITKAEGEKIIKVSDITEFPEEMQELIKKDPERAGQLILKNDNLKETRGVNMSNKNTKTAADSSNHEVITEKQLEKKEESLHPRLDTSYNTITEGSEQLSRGSDLENLTTSESPETHKGSYETITEDQLDLSNVTAEIIHYNDTPDVITEKQWDEMSRLVSAKLSEDYTSVITDKQLRELLLAHRFTGPIDIITQKQLEGIDMTEGLKRWASKEYTQSLTQVATKAIVDSIVKFNKSPKELAKIASWISDNDKVKSKVAFLSVMNALPNKKEEREIIANKERYFSKKASSSITPTVDALIIAVADNAKFGLKAEDVFDYISYSLRSKTAMAKVDELVQIKMGDVDTLDKKIINKYDAFETAIKELSKPEDGKYRIYATLEDVDAPVTDKEGFLKGLKKLAQQEIGSDVAAAIIKVQVGDNGELIIDIEEGGKNEVSADELGNIIEGPVEDIEMKEKENEESPCATAISSDEQENKKLASAREEIVKKAQMMGGEMGGQGGASQGPGAGASLPMAPGAGADTAPLETFTGEPEMGEEEGTGEEDLEPLPPGSICPVCGSHDVDVVAGTARCKNCGSEFNIKIELEFTKYKGVSPEGEEGEEGEGEELGNEEGEFGEGEGFALPEGETPAVAAYTKLTPETLKKIGEKKIKLGTISPATGKANTLDLGEGNHVCLDTGTRYKVSYVTDNKAKEIWGQWTWIPKTAMIDCPSCKKAKQKFVEALKRAEIKEENFEKMELQEKVKVIGNLVKAGAIKSIKTASKEGSVLEDYKLAYGTYGKSFPIEGCREKLARRFGQNALALSGPCEGQNLVDCVCNQLKQADIYTHGLAIKLAEAWHDCSGDEECIADQVRAGYTLREASSICETLKIAVAAPEDLLADELENQGEEETGIEGPPTEPIEDIDPFELEEGTVTIELPKEVAEQIGEKVDEALGEAGSEEIEVPETPIEEPGEIGPVETGEPGEEIFEETKPVEPVDEGVLEETKPAEILENETDENGTIETEEQEEKNNKVEISLDGQKISESEYSLKEGSKMKSKVGKTGRISMDLSSVINTINKKTGEKEIQQENAQDSTDIGSYTAGEDGSKMGHENETIPSAQKPNVPRDNATMVEEPTELNPEDKPQPVIPSDKATMGHEDEVGLAGGDTRYTGGDKGQGKTEVASIEKENIKKAEEEDDFDIMHMRGFGSSKEGLSRLAKRIIEAGDKKLEPKAPVSVDKDIQPIQDKGTLGNEPKFDPDEPTKTEGNKTESLMGHENETLGDIPKSPADHPSIPANDARMGKEELSPEKQTKDKGTVIAKGDRESEAIRVAGRMLEEKKITASELQKKIEELKSYKLAQIKDFEKSIFASKKGLDTVSDGMSQAVIINETSSVRNSKDDLSNKLASLFSLEQQNQLADEDSTTQLRRSFGKK